jgi:hypothetical protein
MGWMSVVATGLVVRGAARRRQRRADEIERARERDLLRDLTEDTAGEYEIWPPEDHDER